MAAVNIHNDFGYQEKKVCHCFHCFSICHDMMDPDAMILVFRMLVLRQHFHSFSSFTFISSSSLSAIRGCYLLNWGCWHFCQKSWFQPVLHPVRHFSWCTPHISQISRVTICSLDSFPNLEPVRCSMSGSNCCFLICICFSQEAGKVVWYSHLLKYFPQFVVIHRVKGFSIFNEAEIDVFMEFSFFFSDLTDVGNLISGSSVFSKSSFNIMNFSVHVLLKPSFENFDHYFACVWDECNCAVV